MRKIALLPILFCLVVVGCTHSSLSALKGPDGQEWVAISCTHSAKNCWQAAGEFCPAGWVVADEVQSTAHGILPFSHHMRDELLIRCKSPSEVAAPAEQASREAAPTVE
jgi:hypothetical protein